MIVWEDEFSVEDQQIIREMLALIEQYTLYSGLAAIYIYKHTTRSSSEGICAKLHGGPNSRNPPSIVVARLAQEYEFPSRQCNAGINITVQNKYEDWMLVLAHELRHIEQFWRQHRTIKSHTEVDAEAFALKMLKQWRKK